MTDPWFERPLDARAAPGGEIGVNDRRYRGGEFLPFYVPRTVMPQVDEADYPALFDFLAERGIHRVEITEPWQDFRAHQRVSSFRVKAMPAEVLAKPILASKDRYVLDGNHRWHGHKEADTPITAIMLSVAFEEAIAALFAFPRCYSGVAEGQEMERN